MRFYALLVCILGALVAQINSQGRSTSPRNGSGWANSNGVQAALRNIGIGDGTPGQAPSSFNVDSFLATVNNETGTQPRGQGRGRSNNGRQRTTTTTTTTVRPSTRRRTTTTTTTTVRPSTRRRTTTPSTTVKVTTATEAPATAQPLTRSMLTSIENEFAILFDGDVSKIAKYVQMGFHMCVGGCDGCLDLKDSANSALATHYQELRTMHSNWDTVISLADYAVVSTLMAVKAGVERNTDGCDGEQCAFSFVFTAGRRTCSNIDNPPPQRFPEGIDIHSPEGLIDDFGLTNDEMVALMGAHSLGAMHSTVSGFEGPWDLTPTVLDNGYFLALSRVSWTQEFKPLANATQWVGETSSGGNLAMLHADMILQHDFTVTPPRNNASCPQTSGCPHSATSTIVDRYAVDNQLFIDEFTSAVTKMVNTASFDPTRRQVFS